MLKSTPTHRQVNVTHENVTIPIDEEIAPLMKELWRSEIWTVACCQEHEGTGKVWLEFQDSRGAGQFLNRVTPKGTTPTARWYRATDWGFGSEMTTARHLREHSDWEYHVSVHNPRDVDGKWDPETRALLVTVSVLFPRTDLEEVTANLKRYNDTKVHP